jgi:hypothetical protein
MDLRRLRAGEWITGASGALLLVSLFLPWYEGAASLSAWETLAVLDIVLALIAAAAVLLVVVTATQPAPGVPVAMASLVALVGLIGLVLVLVRVANLPDGADGREWGLFVGLAGAVGIVAGAFVAMRDERLSPPGRHTDSTGRPAPPPSEIETLPAPRPGR